MADSTMTALAVTQLSKKVELIDMPRPQADAGMVVVKTLYSGVSIGTEMWLATGARGERGDPPFVNGYQATGEIVQVGDDVTDFAPGDMVVTFCKGNLTRCFERAQFGTQLLPFRKLQTALQADFRMAGFGRNKGVAADCPTTR